jgi:hypothetical protein
MAIALRQFQGEGSARTVEEIQALIDGLAAARQRLRSDRADDLVLEQNRLEIAGAQWELSRALIQRYLPVAVA